MGNSQFSLDNKSSSSEANFWNAMQNDDDYWGQTGKKEQELDHTKVKLLLLLSKSDLFLV